MSLRSSRKKASRGTRKISRGVKPVRGTQSGLSGSADAAISFECYFLETV